jgi:IS30 family transposase
VSGKEEFAGKNKNTTFNMLTLEDRKNLQRFLDKKLSIKDISKKLEISRSTIYHERMRMGSIKDRYIAEIGHKNSIESRKVRYKADIPVNHHKLLVIIHKNLSDVIRITKNNNIKDMLKESLRDLEIMGIEKNKFRNVLSIQEKFEIERLMKEGKSCSEIGKIMGRSRSTVADLLHKLRKKESDKTPDERITLNDDIKRKWIS